MAEIETPPANPAVTSTATVTAAEQRREKDRERQARSRAQRRDPSQTHVGARPGGQPAPEDAPEKRPPLGNPFAGFRDSWATFTKKAGETVGPHEARRQLWHMHVAVARLIRSEVDFQERDFEEAGGAFEEVANHWFPWLRIVVRIGAPLLLAGALIHIWSRMLSETPWYVAWRDRRRGPVVEAPVYEPAKDPISGGAPTEPAAAAPAAENGTIPHPPPMPRFRRR